jgi:hypothetical protein
MLKKVLFHIGLRPTSTQSLEEILGASAYSEMLNHAKVQARKSGKKTPAVLLTDDDLVALYLYTHQDLHAYHYKSSDTPNPLKGMGFC